MAIQKRLTKIEAVFQNNGEGRVYFHHKERVRAEGRDFDGDDVRAGIRIEDFRQVEFTLSDSRTFTGAQWEEMCALIGMEMERQAVAREIAKAEAERRKMEREQQLEDEKAALQAEIAAKQAELDAKAQAAAAAIAAEAEQIERQSRGRAAREGGAA